MGGVLLVGTNSVNGAVRCDGGVLLVGTKSVNSMVCVNRTERGDGWCVAARYQYCKWYGVCKQNGKGWCRL